MHCDDIIGTTDSDPTLDTYVVLYDSYPKVGNKIIAGNRPPHINKESLSRNTNLLNSINVEEEPNQSKYETRNRHVMNVGI